MKVAVFNDTSGDKKHLGCALVMRQLDVLIGQCGGEIVFRWPFDRDWRTAPNELPKPGDVDLVVVNGEGSMHGAPKRVRATALAELGAFAKSHLRVPSVLLNATLQNNDASFYEHLRDFDLVWLRDTMSCETARKHGIEAHHCPDLTLGAPVETPFPIRKGIGVTGSVSHRQDLALRSFAHQIGGEFVAMVETRSPPLTAFLKPRIGAIRAAWRELARFRDIGNTSTEDPQKFITWISGKELVVTGRYHTATLCVLTSTPFLYLESNTSKTTAFITDVGLSAQRMIQSSDLKKENDTRNLVHRSRFSNSELEAVTEFLLTAKNRLQDLRKTIITPSERTDR